MGLSYKSGSSTFHSLSDNAGTITSSYPINADGYFGNKGKSHSDDVRNIESENPSQTAKDFYDTIAYGGIESNIVNKKTNEVIGQTTKLKDGTVVSWREVSSSDGSPAIDINISQSKDSAGIAKQKIHFVKEK